MFASYQELKKANPNFPLLVREAEGAKATLVARYGAVHAIYSAAHTTRHTLPDFGKEVAIDVEGKSSGDIATHLQELVKAGDSLPRCVEVCMHGTTFPSCSLQVCRE